MQLDKFQSRKIYDEENVTLAIFFSKCRKNHQLKECPLNKFFVYGICVDDHPANQCSFLLGLKAVYRPSGIGGHKEIIYISR